MAGSGTFKGLIAACGMNCGICIGHLRKRNPCGGCFKKDDINKPKSCRSCTIVNCEMLEKTRSGFCYECDIYPCTRLKRLDKRYKAKYGMSMIDNLQHIRNQGLEGFLAHEKKRWTCTTCESILCVHRGVCLNCNTRYKPDITGTQ